MWWKWKRSPKESESLRSEGFDAINCRNVLYHTLTDDQPDGYIIIQYIPETLKDKKTLINQNKQEIKKKSIQSKYWKVSSEKVQIKPEQQRDPDMNKLLHY